MDRRNFIRQTTGGRATFKKALPWAAAILVIFLLMRSDLLIEPSSVLSLLKILGFLLLCLAVLMVVAFVLSFAVRRISKLIPQSINSWFQTNKKRLEYLLIGMLLAYIVYNSIRKGEYTPLVFYGLIMIVSIYLEWDKKQSIKEKSQ
jgi:hypothetical protein